MPNAEKIKEKKQQLHSQKRKVEVNEDPEFEQVINNALLHVNEYKEKRKAILTHSPSKSRVPVP